MWNLRAAGWNRQTLPEIPTRGEQVNLHWTVNIKRSSRDPGRLMMAASASPDHKIVFDDNFLTELGARHAWRRYADNHPDKIKTWEFRIVEGVEAATKEAVR